MKAILVHEAGGADVMKHVEDKEVPTLSDGQVLVKNNVSGVNFIDTYFRQGHYPAPAGFPMVIGQEASGTIAKIQGENKYGFKEGDRVVWIAFGGYAEYTAVAAGRAIKIPEGVSDEHAVGGFLMGMTALSLVKEAFEVKKGHTILVHAAAGGMGLLLCQIMRDIGATVIGTAGGPEKCELAKKAGATHVIDYKASSGPSWVEQVMKLTDGQGVDCTFDGVGKDTHEGSLEVAKRKSKVVFFGAGQYRASLSTANLSTDTLLQQQVAPSPLSMSKN
jgi:NADPH2:quinone reductase